MLSAGSISYSINSREETRKIHNSPNSTKVSTSPISCGLVSNSINNNTSTPLNITKNEPRAVNKKNNIYQQNIDKEEKPLNNISANQVINYNGTQKMGIYNYQDNNKDKIQVLHEKENNDHKFIFYNNKNSYLGSFNISQLIKYILLPVYGTKSEYHNHQDSFELIRNLIFDIDLNKDSYLPNVKFKSYYESPFTGDIEMLLKLSSGINEYEHNHMETDLLKIENINMRKKVRLIIKHFYFLLLNHMLRVINSISEQIKNDNRKKDIKDKLLKYSIGINNKINNYVRNQLELQVEQNKNFGENMIKILDVKKKVIQKIDNLENIIERQNKKLDDLINQLHKLKNKTDFSSDDLDNNKSANSMSGSNKSNKSTSSMSGSNKFANSISGSNNSLSSGYNMSMDEKLISIDEKLKEKFNCDNLESLFDDDENNFEDINGEKCESITSLESSINKSDTYSQVSAIYKI